MIKEGEGFKRLYATYWNAKVSSVANRRQKLRKLNKKVTPPETSDLIKFKKWGTTEMEKYLENKQPSLKNWMEAAEVTLVRCAIFNKRRISEVAEMRISDYKQANGDVNEEWLPCLDLTERALAKR